MKLDAKEKYMYTVSYNFNSAFLWVGLINVCGGGMLIFAKQNHRVTE